MVSAFSRPSRPAVPRPGRRLSALAARALGRRRLLAAGLGVLLAGCALQAPQVPETREQRPPGFPEGFYRQSAQLGHPVFDVDPSRSLVVIEVRRGGSLARLGHDHVIASHNVRGEVAPGDARADVYLRVDELVIDEPELRAEAGFDTHPTEEAIAGTRQNMLAAMHAEQHPYALVSVTGVKPDAAGHALEASVTLNGVARVERIPVHIERDAEQLTVSGRLTLEQTHFGIVPVSLFGGALLVQDATAVRFVIYAHRPLP